MATIAWGTVFYGHSVYLATLSGSGKWKIGEISNGILVFWMASLPGTLFVGYLIDSRGARSVIILGAVCISVALIGIGLAKTLWIIYLCYGLMGFAYPAVGAAAISAILAPWFSKNFGGALGVALTGASLGGAVIPVMMVHLIHEFGFMRTMLSIGPLIFIVLVIVSMIGLINKPPLSNSNWVVEHGAIDIMQLMKLRLFWRIAVAAGLGLGGQVGFLAHQIPIASRIVNDFDAASTVSIVAVSAAVGRLLVTYASRTISSYKLAAACYFLQGIGIAIVSVANSLSMLVLGCAVAGFVVGAIVMLPPILVRQAFGSYNYGKNYALINAGMYASAGISPWAVGTIYDQSLSYLPGLMLLLTMQIVAAILICRPIPERPLSP